MLVPAFSIKRYLKNHLNAVLELDNIGLSLLEISHRSPEFVSIMNEARELSLELSGLNSDEYATLFLQGGAVCSF